MLRRQAREILGLPPVYQTAELEAAFRRQARRTHPDNGGDADAFEAVTEAHRVLGLGRTPAGNVVFVDDRGRLARLARKLRRRALRPPRVR